MGQHETIPRLNGNPLNLLYKGVFSTRMKGRNNSKYSHYLDKLYQIQFLGIGTHGAKEEEGYVPAVAVKLTSIGGEPTWEKVDIEKTNIVDISDLRLGDLVPVYANVLEHLNSNLSKIREVSTGRYLESSGKILTTLLGGGEVADRDKELLINFLYQEVADTEGKVFNYGESLVEAARPDKSGLILLSEQFIKTGEGDIQLYVDMVKAHKDVNVEALESYIKKMYGDVIDFTEVANETKLRQIEVGGEEVSKLIRTVDIITSQLADIDKVRRIYVTDEESLFNLIKTAEFLDDLKNIFSRSMHEALSSETGVGDKVLITDITEDLTATTGYNEVIEDTIARYIEMAKKAEGLADVMLEEMTREVEDKLRAMTGREIHAEKLQEAVQNHYQEGGTKVGMKAEIEYDHVLALEDTRKYKAVLDALYSEFNKVLTGTEEESATGGNKAKVLAESLQDYVLGEKMKLNTVIDGAVISEGRTATEFDLMAGEHGEKVTLYQSQVGEDEVSVKIPLSNTVVDEGIAVQRVSVKESVKGESVATDLTSSDPVFVGDSREEEFHAEMTDSHEDVPVYIEDYILADMTNSENDVVFSPETDTVADITSRDNILSPYREEEILGEMTSEPQEVTYDPDRQILADMTSEDKDVVYVPDDRVVATKVKIDKNGKVVEEYELAVFGCAPPPDLKYRRRPPLEPDKVPEDPLFEWICTEGYVCDDWLIVPLRDFNFENPDMDGFYDPNTFKPYFPTGKYDENGDPYVLPPYSVLNEPISNGADVGGKEPMSIDPCNLYSFIDYIVKVYDAYKNRFQASAPTDTMSRVMNLVYGQVVRLINEWDESKGYTPDELWRIYRFIRWMALGLTHRFYRTKIEYTYGDFEETFDVFPYQGEIMASGAVRRLVTGYGWVLDGRPPVTDVINSAKFEFTVPMKLNSSVISFDIGNVVPDRPDEIIQGGDLFYEDFEGAEPLISGTGWVLTNRQSGRSLSVEDPARKRTYKTTSFNVPSSSISPIIQFNYGIDTNMETKLKLMKGNQEVWASSGVVPYGAATVNIAEGDYHFEVNVPQEETTSLTNISFTAQQIQDEWQKVGHITDWKVVGNTIYEEENTGGMAMVINNQWTGDDEYEFEGEFYTEEYPELYPLYDWLGFVFNYKDANNYYLVGTWSDLDGYAYSGVHKVVNGQNVYGVSNPTWRFNGDFRWRFNTWHKMKVVVKGNRFTVSVDGVQRLDVTDTSGWGHGASGLAAWSNPFSSFRNFKYKGKPRFDSFIDNVRVYSPTISVPVGKPKYLIDFTLDGEERVMNYSEETKRSYSFPILSGEHSAEWTFRKQGTESTVTQDASFVDTIRVKGVKVVGAKVVEEFISCGGHMSVKLLIENLLEYYRRHHQGCKGERNIWIIE